MREKPRRNHLELDFDLEGQVSKTKLFFVTGERWKPTSNFKLLEGAPWYSQKYSKILDHYQMEFHFQILRHFHI